MLLSAREPHSAAHTLSGTLLGDLAIFKGVDKFAEGHLCGDEQG